MAISRSSWRPTNRARADYSFLRLLDSRVRVLDDVAQATGPGLARNRALTAARGSFIALLDADDLWSPDYLAELLPLAERHGAAFGATRITDWQGRTLREIQPATRDIGIADFATAFASVHGIARHLPERRWLDILAEDVLFDLETLALVGGHAPFVAEAVYHLRLRPRSMTRGGAFVARIGAGYDRLKALIRAGDTLIPSDQCAASIAVFDSWQRMNIAFGAAVANEPALDFQSFVAKRLLG
ncbi:glycosyltransferase [Dongia mobilis]|jgi:glycosyltransferase involved in cell wall biosynthesis|uniref:glycosyltransferase n=1 Tax=Dongia sp. TaxID=1977262 RepID=UPI0026EADD55